VWTVPVRHRIDTSQRIVFVTYVDPVTARDWTDAIEGVLSDPRFDRDFNFLADRRSAPAPDPGFARQIVDFLETRRQEFGKHLRVAILVNDPTAFGMARLQQILNERANVESEVFGDEAAALRWVKALPSDPPETRRPRVVRRE
jgi:hypothetical protein